MNYLPDNYQDSLDALIEGDIDAEEWAQRIAPFKEELQRAYSQGVPYIIPTPNFQGAELEGVAFRYLQFTNPDFSGSLITGAQFDHCTFEGNTSFENTDLELATIRYCKFENGTLNVSLEVKDNPSTNTFYHCEFNNESITINKDDAVGIPIIFQDCTLDTIVLSGLGIETYFNGSTITGSTINKSMIYALYVTNSQLHNSTIAGEPNNESSLLVAINNSAVATTTINGVSINSMKIGNTTGTIYLTNASVDKLENVSLPYQHLVLSNSVLNILCPEGEILYLTKIF